MTPNDALSVVFFRIFFLQFIIVRALCFYALSELLRSGTYLEGDPDRYCPLATIRIFATRNRLTQVSHFTIAI